MSSNPFFKKGENIDIIARDSVIQIENYISRSTRKLETDIEKLGEFINLSTSYNKKLSADDFDRIRKDLIDHHLSGLVDLIYAKCVVKNDQDISNQCNNFIFLMWDNDDHNNRFWTYFCLKIVEGLGNQDLMDSVFWKHSIGCGIGPTSVYSSSHWYLMWHYLRECEFKVGGLKENAKSYIDAINLHEQDIEGWDFEPCIELIIDKLHEKDDSSLFWDIIKLPYWSTYLSLQTGYLTYVGTEWYFPDGKEKPFWTRQPKYFEPIVANLYTKLVYDQVLSIADQGDELMPTKVEMFANLRNLMSLNTSFDKPLNFHGDPNYVSGPKIPDTNDMRGIQIALDSHLDTQLREYFFDECQRHKIQYSEGDNENEEGQTICKEFLKYIKDPESYVVGSVYLSLEHLPMLLLYAFAEHLNDLGYGTTGWSLELNRSNESTLVIDVKIDWCDFIHFLLLFQKKIWRPDKEYPYDWLIEMSEIPSEKYVFSDEFGPFLTNNIKFKRNKKFYNDFNLECFQKVKPLFGTRDYLYSRSDD